MTSRGWHGTGSPPSEAGAENEHPDPVPGLVWGRNFTAHWKMLTNGQQGA